jgi:hypothetical protein
MRRQLAVFRSIINPGASPPDPLHRHSLAASPARSVPVARSLPSLAVLGFAPGLPTPSLARALDSSRPRASAAKAGASHVEDHHLDLHGYRRSGRVDRSLPRRQREQRRAEKHGHREMAQPLADEELESAEMSEHGHHDERDGREAHR